ncbi:MAG TPA: hypothetical protein PKC30_10450 [Saprospiraceae bacterium]|nr:hypothetical protein [Saprospiraceae bacterium]
MSDLKKLFFAKKAVTKSALDKSTDHIKERKDELFSEEKELNIPLDSTDDKSSSLRDAFLKESKSVVDKSKDVFESLSEKLSEKESVKKAADFTEKLGSKILDEGEKAMDKAKTLSEKVGETVLKSSDDFKDKTKDLSENVGRKTIELGSELKERAQKVMNRLGNEMEKTMERAEKWAEEEKNKPKKDFADDTMDTKGSLLDDKDDFFAKAARFADGDYDVMKEGKTTIKEDKDESIERREPARAAGYEDLDGDGNELIDDAIIIGEEE